MKGNKKMITAIEAKTVTLINRQQQRDELIEKLIKWCESLEKCIIESANKGTWCIFVRPDNYGHLLPEEDRDKIITIFFEELGYTISHTYSNISKFTISWR